MLVGLLVTSLTLILAAYPAAAAGTIYFRDGRFVQADDWWEDGAVFYYVTRGGQQADSSSNIARVQGEPNWARPYRTNARILFKKGVFIDADFVIIAPDEVLIVDRQPTMTTTTHFPRSDVIRVVPIPATERGCAATTITRKELILTEEMVDWTSSLKGGAFTSVNNRLRQCLELRRQAMGGSRPDANAMARACCAD